MRLLLFLFLLGLPALAQEGRYALGRILALDPGAGLAQVRVEGRTLEALLPVGGEGFGVGDRVVVYLEGERAYVTEPDRMPWLAALALLFALGAVGLGRGKGLRGLLGTLFGLLLLVYVVVPRIAAGGDPLLHAFLGSLGVLVLSVYFVHGLGRKTTAALGATLAAVLLVLLLGRFFAQAMGFTGLASEEALLLHQWGGVDLLGLYLAGLAVGALGALADVTVTQASVVQALAHADPQDPPWRLYRRAMEVGYDHLGSLVNTLVLAYAAGSLPLFLLLTRDPTPLRFLLNTEPFAAELVGMLLGSLGLVLAVPLSTRFAAFLLAGGKGEGGDHAHPH